MKAGPTSDSRARMLATVSPRSTPKSYGRSCVAASHIASWPTSRDSSERRVGSESMPSTEIETGASSTSSDNASARSTISPISHTWCSTIRVSSSMPVTFLSAGTRRPPGGLKCTPFGVRIWNWAGFRRQRDGGAP